LKFEKIILNALQINCKYDFDDFLICQSRLDSMSLFQGVLFDMDGVLIDSEPLHNLKWIEVLNDLGIHSEFSWFDKFVGVPDRLIAEEILRNFKLTNSIDELIRKKQLKYKKYIESVLSPAPDLIAAIKSLYKFRLGLVTASDKAEAEMIAKSMGFNSLFDVIVGGNEVINNKPNPEIYLKATFILGINPSLCIAVEDSGFGVQSAKKAGLFVIGVTNTLADKGLKEADQVCRNTLEAISYIKTLN
jgi:beta-phosphoglucomutase